MKLGTVFILLWLVIGVATGADSGGSVLLEPSRTRVGLARVRLNVSRLDVVDDSLVGSYEIRVPLAPWMNDRGSIRLDLAGSPESELLPGNEIQGTGTSDLDQRTHGIRCRFDKADGVRIDVDTGDRVLSFRSRWVRGS